MIVEALRIKTIYSLRAYKKDEAENRDEAEINGIFCN
jgi:hypothetical protein